MLALTPRGAKSSLLVLEQWVHSAGLSVSVRSVAETRVVGQLLSEVLKLCIACVGRRKVVAFSLGSRWFVKVGRNTVLKLTRRSCFWPLVMTPLGPRLLRV